MVTYRYAKGLFGSPDAARTGLPILLQNSVNPGCCRPDYAGCTYCLCGHEVHHCDAAVRLMLVLTCKEFNR